MSKELKKDLLTVKIYQNRAEMGAAAADDIADKIREILGRKEEINMIFAAAPSQNEMLDSLTSEQGIDWNRVNAFHMDEYLGLPAEAPQGFGNFLKERLFHKLNFRSVNYLDGQSSDPEAECRRYASLLARHPADIVCLGVGENGHVAFNDPPVADFQDPRLVKPVRLDPVCRNQQVHDGCFQKLEDVPTQALTLTVPALFRGRYLFCVVPASTKAKAVRRMLEGPIEEACPASVLRRHAHAVLYLDPESSSLLDTEAE